MKIDSSKDLVIKAQSYHFHTIFAFLIKIHHMHQKPFRSRLNVTPLNMHIISIYILGTQVFLRRSYLGVDFKTSILGLLVNQNSGVFF